MNNEFASKSGLSQQDLEEVYEALAHEIDNIGPQKAPLMLTKLALLCAHELGDSKLFQKQLKIASIDLE